VYIIDINYFLLKINPGFNDYQPTITIRSLTVSCKPLEYIYRVNCPGVMLKEQHSEIKKFGLLSLARKEGNNE